MTGWRPWSIASEKDFLRATPCRGKLDLRPCHRAGARHGRARQLDSKRALEKCHFIDISLPKYHIFEHFGGKPSVFGVHLKLPLSARCLRWRGGSDPG